METTFDRTVCENNRAEESTDQRLKITMLGALEVFGDGKVLQAHQLGGPKARQILEILLLHLGTPVSKGLLIDLLWDGRAPQAAISTLESYVSVLRRCLQPGSGKNGVLKTATGGYIIEACAVDVDLMRFDELVHRAAVLPDVQAHECLCQALALASGPLLGSELLPEWAETERRIHAARVTIVMAQCAELALHLGLHAEAAERAQCVLDTDPLNEQAWSVLVLALEASHNPVEGLRAYERCRVVLDRELGCTPGVVLRSAQHRLLNATCELDDDFARAVHALLAIHGVIEGKKVLNDAANGLKAAGSVLTGYLDRAQQLCA